MADLKRAKAVILGNLLSSYFKKVGGSRLAGLLKLLKGEMDVKLSKLELKDDILNDFGLPLKIVRSYIGAIHIEKSSIWNIVITEVYVIVSPILVVGEEVSKKKDQSKKKQNKLKSSIIDKLFCLFMKNFQLNVKNFHIRYEDSITNPGTTIAIGVCLDSFELNSTDSHCKKIQKDILHLKMELNSFGMYYSTLASQNVTNDSWIEWMQGQIPKPGTHCRVNGYLLYPMTISASIDLNAKTKIDFKKMTGTFNCDEIFLSISEEQLKNLVSTLEVLSPKNAECVSPPAEPLALQTSQPLEQDISEVEPTIPHSDEANESEEEFDELIECLENESDDPIECAYMEDDNQAINVIIGKVTLEFSMNGQKLATFMTKRVTAALSYFLPPQLSLVDYQNLLNFSMELNIEEVKLCLLNCDIKALVDGAYRIVRLNIKSILNFINSYILNRIDSEMIINLNLKLSILSTNVVKNDFSLMNTSGLSLEFVGSNNLTLKNVMNSVGELLAIVDAKLPLYNKAKTPSNYTPSTVIKLIVDQLHVQLTLSLLKDLVTLASTYKQKLHLHDTIKFKNILPLIKSQANINGIRIAIIDDVRSHQALVLKFSVFSQLNCESNYNSELNIKDLEVTRNSSHNLDKVISNVVPSCSIKAEIYGSFIDVTSITVSVIIEPVVIRLSPAVIHFIVHIVNTLKPPEPLTKMPLTTAKPFSKFMYELPEPSEVDGPTLTNIEGGKNNLNLRLKSLKVTFNEEKDPCERIDQDVLSFDVHMIELEAYNWIDQLKVNCEIEASYFNKDLNVWEPILEPLELSSGELQRWRVELEIKLRNLFKLSVRAIDPLQITLTDTSIQLIKELVQIIEVSANSESPCSDNVENDGNHSQDCHSVPEGSHCVYLQNMLPVEIRIESVDYNISPLILKPGYTHEFVNLEVAKCPSLDITLPSEDLRGQLKLLQELTNEINFIVEKDSTILRLRMSYQNHHYTVYCPYWMVNKTGLELSYKDKKSGRTYTHNPDKNILMFSPEDKQCPEITLSFSDSKKWSSYVSLKDSVGNDRRISLNSSDNCVYDIGISIQFAKFALTKLVIITPYYLISNQFSHDIKIIEEDHALGDCISVPKGQVVPFWPQINSSHVMIDIGTSKTAMFNYKETESLVLRLSEEPLAVCVDLQSTENSHVITVSSYYDSCAPVVFVNLLQDATIIFQQDLKGPISEYTLAPGEAVHYTWDDPTGSRLIRWRIKSGETDPEPVSIDISKDGEGSFTYSLGQGAVMELSGSSPLEELSSPSSDSGSFVKSEDNVHVQSNEQRKAFWKSFAVNAQIAILFTDSMEKLDYISSEKNDEICNAEVNISLGFVGLSLVDNKNKKELAYIALKQHGVMWQVSHENGSWELLDSNYIQLLEEACKELQNDVATDGLVVNLESMEIYEPMRGKLQRTCYNGVHVNIKIFEKSYQLNASFGYVQVDGPLLTCMLYPLPSVTSNEDCKPFLEATIIMHKSSLKHFKDIEYASKNLVDIKSPTVSNLFDVLHIDAVEVKLSFSISTGDVLVQVFKEDTNFSLSDSCFKLGKKLRFEKLHMINVVASCYKSDVRNIMFMVLYILIKGKDLKFTKLLIGINLKSFFSGGSTDDCVIDTEALQAKREFINASTSLSLYEGFMSELEMIESESTLKRLFNIGKRLIKRAQNLIPLYKKDTVDIHVIRPTRFIGNDGIVHPYSFPKALGKALFKKAGKNDSELCDYVNHHCDMPDELIIITDRRYMIIKKRQGQWNITQQLDFRYFKREPSYAVNIINIPVDSVEYSMASQIFLSSEEMAKEVCSQLIKGYEKFKH